MWMIDPRLLCRKHLLGEHKELHMLAGCLSKGKSITGYINKGLLEPQNMISRHQEICIEMIRRGYDHRSPIVVHYSPVHGHVDKEKSIRDLKERCPECGIRIEALK